MPRGRKQPPQYGPETRHKVRELLKTRSVLEVAQETGITPGTIKGWRTRGTWGDATAPAPRKAARRKAARRKAARRKAAPRGAAARQSAPRHAQAPDRDRLLLLRLKSAIAKYLEGD